MEKILIQDWDRAVKKFWSFRLSILAALLSGLEVVVQLWQPFSIHPGVLAAIAGVVSLAAAIARIVAQPKAYRP